jgi:hypothetical protein
MFLAPEMGLDAGSPFIPTVVLVDCLVSHQYPFEIGLEGQLPSASFSCCVLQWVYIDGLSANFVPEKLYHCSSKHGFSLFLKGDVQTLLQAPFKGKSHIIGA